MECSCQCLCSSPSENHARGRSANAMVASEVSEEGDPEPLRAGSSIRGCAGAPSTPQTSCAVAAAVQDGYQALLRAGSSVKGRLMVTFVNQQVSCDSPVLHLQFSSAG